MDFTQFSDEDLQDYLDTTENDIRVLEAELEEVKAQIRGQIMALRPDYDAALLEDQRRRHERRDPSLDQHIGE